jgi:single-stranded-DNA-specific exonuclease
VIQTRRWQAAPYAYGAAHELARELGVSPTLASILARRGLGEAAAARRFLEADESHDAFEFEGIDHAVALILRHAGAGGTIAVHGDYDVDGVCSTAVLVEALQTLGANVLPRLPSRGEDGYGLSSRTVRDLATRGVGLLITSDCGIGAIEEVALAQSLGMEVVVTDHHRPGEELPSCAVVHPVVSGYPFAELCATGVVFKLSQALFRAAGRDERELEPLLDLVALATVADLVPLIGENRSLVRRGLRALAGTGRPGLRALMKVAGVEPQAVSEQSIGFVLAPRINAAGRLYRADAALELLLTRDDERALQIARELDAINTERQSVETRILFEAESALSALGEARDEPAHVLAGEGWHAGVIGIVASRLVERYHRPFVLVALDEGGHGRGSGRSISAYDLHAGLSSCADHLLRFGGHRMAAGLEIEAASVEQFRAALAAHARESLTQADLVAVERVDAIVPGDTVGLDLAEELELLRPFGMGNPGVQLLVPAARVSDVQPMGEGRHARMTLTSGGVRTRAVVFGASSRVAMKDTNGARHDLVGRLEANEWGGAVEPRLVLRSLHPIEPCEDMTDCSSSDSRARGDDWWALVRGELDAPLAAEGCPQEGPRTVVDARGLGLLGCLGDLLSTGESLAVVCADATRRQGLFLNELDPRRFGRGPAAIAAAGCSPAVVDALLGSGREADAVCLTDYATVTATSRLLDPFTHVFALDPPVSQTAAGLLGQSAPELQASFLHLGWGAAEVEFAGKVLAHEYALRPSLAAIYRLLRDFPQGLGGDELERGLSGEGRHPRSPALIGRCLRVLSELGLAFIDPSTATVRCTANGGEKVNLERSSAFQHYTRIYEEGTRFLSGPAQPMRTASAA